MPRFAHLIQKPCFVALLGLAILACGTSGLPSTQTATGLPAEITTPGVPAVNATQVPAGASATPKPSTSEVTFKVAVIVDTLSEPVTREQAQGVMDEADKLIKPFVQVGLEMVDFVQDGGGGTTREMASRYLASHPAAQMNGILIFSFGDGGRAKLTDGYSDALPAPAGTRNTFISPAGSPDQIYIAVVHFGSRYMACGYGDTDTIHSATAIGGECRNKPGTACVQNNGYSMCANAVASLYASTPTHYVSSTVIHMFLHSFSPGGDKDNYATPECNARMGYPAGFFDLQESQYYNGICPFVYENFAAAYHP